MRTSVSGSGSPTVPYFGRSGGLTWVGAVVSRGGRPDLAGRYLPRVRAPTLLLVGGNDFQVIELNRAALAQLRCEKELVIVPGATQLFEDPGALDQVARPAREWFQKHLVQEQALATRLYW